MFGVHVSMDMSACGGLRFMLDSSLIALIPYSVRPVLSATHRALWYRYFLPTSLFWGSSALQGWNYRWSAVSTWCLVSSRSMTAIFIFSWKVLNHGAIFPAPRFSPVLVNKRNGMIQPWIPNEKWHVIDRLLQICYCNSLDLLWDLFFWEVYVYCMQFMKAIISLSLTLCSILLSILSKNFYRNYFWIQII